MSSYSQQKSIIASLTLDTKVKILRNIVFTENIQKIWNQIASYGAIRQLQYNQWCINSFQYDEDSWKKMFKLIQQTRIKSLVIYQSYIKSINFSNLSQLHLQHNNIKNIESLSLIKCLRLKCLCLGHNEITSLKVLSKVYFYELKSFHLERNFIFNKLENISRFFMNKRQLSCQKTDFLLNLQQEIYERQYEDLSYFVEAQGKIMFRLNSQGKIQQNKIRQLIKKKMMETKEF